MKRNLSESRPCKRNTMLNYHTRKLLAKPILDRIKTEAVSAHFIRISNSISRHHRQHKKSYTKCLLAPNPSINQMRSVNYALEHAWAPSTRAKYANGIQHFISFCNREKIPHSMRLPASEFLLCAFAADSIGLKAGGTIKNDIAAVRSWHIKNNAPWHAGLRLSYVLRGANNLTPATSKRAPRPPISADMLSVLHDNLSLSEPLDSAVFFMATAAFYGQIRLGELLPDSKLKSAPEHFPSLSDAKLPNARGSRKVHLPRTKTAGLHGEDIILCRQHGNTDPIAAFENHCSINALAPSSRLASFMSPSGTHTILTKRKFLARCNEIWSSHGFPVSTGHSFRIGGTTHFLLCKVPPDIVKALGRWSSDAFLRYWRSLDLIAPMYIEFIRLIIPKTP
jgi:hypothetical protein